MRGHTPANTRLYAIGDIHGCDQALAALLDKISQTDCELPDVQHRQLIFLGDYIDRGPNSAEVVEILLHDLPAAFEPVFLKGNHEAMMLEALNKTTPAEFWLRNGGYQTMASYGLSLQGEGAYTSNIELAFDQLQQRLEGAHRQFYEGLQLYHRSGGYYFVHAGINPQLLLEDQNSRDLLWIREPFLFSDKQFEAVIVHGHTPGRSATIKENRICIDTGAVYNGKLTAVMLEGDRQTLISATA